MMADRKTAPKTMAGFDADLAEVSIRGQWQYDEMMERLIGGPKTQAQPFVWQWSVIQKKLMEACEVMPESYTARRNLSFINPGLERGGTTQTVLAGMQIVKPGEVAWAHRHPISALRFAIEGDAKLYTVVNGEALPMEPNDLVLTPPWTWHDHHNESDRNGIWLDVLDVPLVMSLGQMAYEPMGETTQPLRERRDDHLSDRVGALRPQWEQPLDRGFPYRYAWKDVQRQLERFADADGSPADGVILEYVNPATGGPTLPTLRCAIQSMRPGFAGQRHRKTASSVYYVVEGEGTTLVGDTELRWGPRDVFAVPAWAWTEHRTRSSSRALLFSVTDAPLLEAIDLYREEPASTVRRSAPPAAPVYALRAS